jgi:hypothetical protein
VRLATPFPELNAVLTELVTNVKTSLGDNLCGAYLHGSFALGDADAHSDVDFLIVTHEQVKDVQRSRLQAMHTDLHKLETQWAQHLEGAYVPKSDLRQVDPSHSPLLYLDSGASELTWANDFNTAVVRWSLREHGIVLDGPDPASLIDPVSAAQLRSEVRAAMDEWTTKARAPFMNRWKQSFMVLSYCRMLHTLAIGRVTSKRQGGEWALHALHAEWAPLIQRALEDRPDPWVKIEQPAVPEDVERTFAFIDYALAEAAARYDGIARS